MTKIEWTEKSWNPIVGCDKISPGCNNCYAEKMAKRLVGMGQEKYFPVVDKKGWTGVINMYEAHIKQPYKWKQPKKIFLGSMGDIFHEAIDYRYVAKLWTVIKDNPHHTFIVLTKRPERMEEFFRYILRNLPFAYYELDNIWIGVSAENQKEFDKRVPILLRIQEGEKILKFVSVEPMLGNINTGHFLDEYISPAETGHSRWLNGLDWVICGAESGGKRRACDDDWVRNLRDQCEYTGTPFFLKQLYEGNKKITMPMLDGRIWDQRPKP